MSARTVIATRAQPARMPVIRMPSVCEARSRAKSAAGGCSARRCAASAASAGSFISVASHCAASSRRTSAPGEARRALFGERRDPFRIVGAVPELALVVALHVQLLRERAAPALVDGLPGAREGAGRCGGELSRQSVHDFGELTVLDAAPDQSPGGGLLGGQLLAEERESHGARRADEARQEPGAAGIRNETELRERLHEARRARRDD